MEKKIFTIALIIGLQLSLTAGAQNHEQVALRVPGFVRPLVEKWVAEYHKTNTNVDFQFVSGRSQDNDNTMSFTIDNDAVAFARFAVLPVTTEQSEAARLIGTHRLNAKNLKKLFFVKNELDDEQKESKAEQQLHIITGNSQQSASRVYAAHFKQETANYKGKKISGDDNFLNNAIQRDPLGITVNSLSNIFDLKSRKVRQGLVLLPLDIDKQGRQVLSEGRLDDILAQLEDQQYNEIPIGNVALAYNRGNQVLNDFAHWILVNGTKYVHEFGLLQLPQKELTASIRRTEQKELAQK